MSRADGTGDEVGATVPGCVHVDLLAAGQIPDPFLDTNELDVAWVADVDWRYRTIISAPAVEHDRTDLVFAGLDTLAEITIDGVEIARTANMHRSYRFDVGALLSDGADHELAITFRSATRAADAAREREGEWPSSAFGRPFNYVRKMACAWGWDWGPWLTTAGIWRPAALHGWDVGRLASVRPQVIVDDDGTGRVRIAGSVERAGDSELAIEARLLDPGGRAVATATAVVSAGVHGFELALEAGLVERWWPVGYGDQPLYTLTVRLAAAGGDPTLDEWQRRIGFRSIVLDTSPDRIGAAFTFVVNGLPIFARGVNWIPDDPFPSRVTPARYRQRLQQAVDANATMIRVWGGGIYEDDAFYDACDELGLLAWQDFTFACAAYPEHLLADEVAAEARENVERLMSHPSLVLWNGNNENLWGYVDWEWQPMLQGRPWGAGFYFDLLPRIVAETDPQRPYWPGSPYSGSMLGSLPSPQFAVHPNADAHGCIHEWGVWNRLDHVRYRDRIPRFVAEFGWQAPPTWSTVRAAISDEPLTPTSPGMLHHQKADDGNGKLERGLAYHADVPDDFDAWLWATQLNQARAVRTGVEHFRSLRGTCMGTIWWQLNDCWPVTSWAVVDSDGRRKPAWYALRDSYSPRLLTIQPRGDALVLFVVNDTADEWLVEGIAERSNLDGETSADAAVSMTVDPWSSSWWVIPDGVSRPADTSGEVLRVSAGGAQAWWWWAADREVRYPAPSLLVSGADVEGLQLVVTVEAGTLLRDLALMADRIEPSLTVDRMLHTLMPGECTTFAIASPDASSLPAPDALMSSHERPLWWTANDLARP